MELEYKELKLEVKADDVDLKEGTFSGYASTFGNVDEGGDIIEKGAFKKTLKEHSDMVKVLRGHLQLIGKPLEMREDNRGLFVKGFISQTELGKETLTLMRDGVLDAMSIGFNTLKSHFDKDKGIRHIKELKLWEFSIVTWGMNTQAKVEAVKSMAGLIPDIQAALMTDDMKQFIKNMALVKDGEPPSSNSIDPDSVQSLLSELKALQSFF